MLSVSYMKFIKYAKFVLGLGIVALASVATSKYVVETSPETGFVPQAHADMPGGDGDSDAGSGGDCGSDSGSGCGGADSGADSGGDSGDSDGE